ncbi:MAG: DNA topoisomerase IB [Proteobacteria bacterium]|nr:DNA topoisomerase IB [Pseudomonadota bacterium]
MLTLNVSATEAIADTKEAAESAGLTYVSDSDPGIRRRRRGKGFEYLNARGGSVRDAATLNRIRGIVIPPAWTDVWICSQLNGHIQATGRDARGRKQYRYHPHFRAMREETKYHQMIAFAEVLPQVRATVDKHLALSGLRREKVLAAVVYLLEATLIRIGNDEYARNNKSYGLTTLKRPHVAISGSALKFKFKGKSGKEWNLSLRDRRIAKVIRSCQDLPGQHLFQYVDETGETRNVASSDVNDYLGEISGREITAKDFRTWHGTVLAAIALNAFETFETLAAAKRNVRDAIREVAARLGNTPTICRKCYVHPEVLTAYLEGAGLFEMKTNSRKQSEQELTALAPEEVAVLDFLRIRSSPLSKKTKDALRNGARYKGA